jgi:hypothetical protein
MPEPTGPCVRTFNMCKTMTKWSQYATVSRTKSLVDSKWLCAGYSRPSEKKFLRNPSLRVLVMSRVQDFLTLTMDVYPKNNSARSPTK